MKYLLGCLMAAFFVSTAQAQVSSLQMVCTVDRATVFEGLKKEDMQEVFRKSHKGGGEMLIFQNLENGEWATFLTFGPKICLIAGGPDREVGS